MLKQTNNLIHCITNPISINDCANLILALGAKPIMACHPDEVESITSNSSALALNLGNFDDIRAKSMMISAKCAKENKIPFILDLVGVACSTLRLNYAKELVSLYCPTVIKGNISECKAFYGMTSHAHGVDADIQDEEDIYESCKWLKDMALNLGCVVVCSGKIDVITDGKEVNLISNGCDMLSRITGTGCMLNVAIATFLASFPPLNACVKATCYYEVAAEKTECSGPGTFHMHFMDEIYKLTSFDESLFKIEVLG